MVRSFRSYQLAVEFYRLAVAQRVPHHLKDQFLRAASSIALNLSEGASRKSQKDRRRFYEIALGSLRECEAIIELLSPSTARLKEPADKLARHLFRLVHSLD